jgi:hypothetical protein
VKPRPLEGHKLLGMQQNDWPRHASEWLFSFIVPGAALEGDALTAASATRFFLFCLSCARAAFDGDPAALQRLLEALPMVAWREHDAQGNTPLHLAVLRRQRGSVLRPILLLVWQKPQRILSPSCERGD